ncbi:hypothetical protein [Streptomyces laurentii]|uniref:hypothetical protein n=1 Tax=Streptomyces laurentii TaxID=39478 RepID=UPI0036BADD1D
MITTPRGIVAAALGALPLTALLWTAQAQAQSAPTVARPVSVCGNAVQQTRRDLANAGAPTDDTDWQDVRDDAQEFVDEHPWGGGAVEALKRDIQKLDYYCAS